jgi:two-component system, sensor histidine kinase and response regulator
MKTIHQRLFNFQGRIKSIELTRHLDFFTQRSVEFIQWIRSIRFDEFKQTVSTAGLDISKYIEIIKTLGVTRKMDEYEKRKLAIFNQLNFLQMLSWLILPIVGMFDKTLSAGISIQAILPAFISITALALNSYYRHEAALFTYFLLYPIITSVIYMGGVNLGVELNFILYGILSVFFLQHIGQMIFSVGLSMVSYFVLSVLWKNYHYQLETANLPFYLFNQMLAIGFIFYGLYLIKKENTEYQFNILSQTQVLQKKNTAIRRQKKEIAQKANQLEKQAAELAELNAIKNKLFSVIAHDLKTPMYALRNVFRNIHEQNMPADEIKELIPDVMNDLNYTTGLMENLLQWAKTQMNAGVIRPQFVDIKETTGDVLRLLRLQAETKNIKIRNKIENQLHVFADNDMISLVLRNLISNAIKFTPPDGMITVGITEMNSYVEVFVKDTGVGISPEAMQKIRQNDFFTTKGTTNETGTGLGLMLCKEFVVKNGGLLYIESELGKGSVFSFTLPLPPAEEAKQAV